MGALAAVLLGYTGSVLAAAGGIDVTMMKRNSQATAAYPAQASTVSRGGGDILSLIRKGSSTKAAVCGDSEPDAGEECDDGNTTSGDGCDSTCQIEAGSDCTAAIASISTENIVENGSFSNASSAPWLQSGTPFSPICAPPFGCGAGNALSADPEGGWYWAGGSPSDSTTNANQTLTIPTNATTLLADVWEAFCPGDPEDDYITISIDGNVVYDSGLCDDTGSGYEEISVDLAAAPGGPYNDGGVHTIDIDGFMDRDQGDPQTGSVFVDRIRIEIPLDDPIPPVPSSCLVGFCGDGIQSDGESCDDANTGDGDGCSSTCTIEEDSFFCTNAEDPIEVINGSLGFDNDLPDGGFEAGPGGAWTETGTVFEPICSEFFCGAALASEGEFFAWFGGSSNPNMQTLTQADVTISADATELTFDLLIGICDSTTDVLTVEIDGNEVFSTGACADTEAYETQAVDLTSAPGGPYNDDLPHTISFIGNTLAINGGNSNFFVDNVAVEYAVSPDRAPDASFCGALDEACTTIEKFEGVFPPAGWTTFNLSSDPIGAVWGTSADGVCGSANWAGGNTTGGSGVSACIDSDAPNAASTTLGYLCTPELDLSTGVDLVIAFNGNYQTAFYDDDDDPDTPTPEFMRIVTGTVPPNAATLDPDNAVYDLGPILIDHVTDRLDLSGPASYSGSLNAITGQSSAWVCFAYGGEFSWYGQVDNVAVRASDCSALAPDTDGDGVPDTSDNCTVDANADQFDSNGDGIGNVCDADITNDCNVNFGDLAALKAVFFPAPYVADADINGAGGQPDGAVNFADLARMKQLFFNTPGALSPGELGAPGNDCDTP